MIFKKAEAEEPREKDHFYLLVNSSDATSCDPGTQTWFHMLSHENSYLRHCFSLHSPELSGIWRKQSCFPNLSTLS